MSRTILVTGGNRGIGLEIARVMANSGDKVAVTYRNGVPPAEFFGVRCDVTDRDDAERALAEVAQQFGPVQVLVANAGITKDALAPLMSEDAFRDVVETNPRGGVPLRPARRARDGAGPAGAHRLHVVGDGFPRLPWPG